MTAFDSFARSCAQHRPETFVVLGSGMGSLVERIEALAAVDFADIPGVPGSTVSGHAGRFFLGRWAGAAVLVSQGRVHYYEGHPWDVVVTPIRTAARLGVRCAILTNAAGGIRDDLAPGALMPIQDHLEWNRPNPWREPPRPSPYSGRLLTLIDQAGGCAGAGVYAGVTGPSYETPAEIRAVRAAGADAVGMSTTREAIAGAEAGLEVAAISLVTNRAAGLSDAPLDHGEVMAAGAAAAGRLGSVIESVLARLRDQPAPNRGPII